MPLAYKAKGNFFAGTSLSLAGTSESNTLFGIVDNRIRFSGRV